MNEDAQCYFVDLISRIPCATDETVTGKITAPLGLQCSFCSDPKGAHLSFCRHPSLKALGIRLFSKLLKFPSFLQLRRPRVSAMIGLRRMTRHSTASEFWDLEKSGPGQWCLQSLQSSIRELRIAAGRALSVFVAEPSTPDFDPEVLQRNRANALAFLKSLSDKGSVKLHETCIMAWGQVGRVVSTDELNLVIIKLVDYLGYRNLLVSCFTFNELLNLAESKGETPAQLLQPFWASLAFSIVKDLISKPHMARLVADLLQLSVRDLLLMLQKHALPWLVLTKKREVIQKIAEARGEGEIWQPCLDPANFPPILALLLVQEAPDIATNTMSLLGHVSTHMEGFELVDLLRADPLTISLELFKAGGEASEMRRTRVRLPNRFGCQ